MKLILLSETHVKNLHGRWILEVNTDTPDVVITNANWDFMSEKRISLVTNLRLTGLWYDHGDFKTWEEFAFKINHYSKISKDTRFYRLLSNKEIDFISAKFKQGI